MVLQEWLKNENWLNYHCHSMLSNLTIFDSPTTPEDYINRIKELNHTAYVSTEHGISYNWVSKYLLCKEHNIKFIYGVEAYIEVENSRYHILFTAKNYNGLLEINRCINQAVMENFKYLRPCITIEMIKQHINPQNVFCTTACIAGILKDNTLTLFKELHKIFSNNLFLEVQPHQAQEQIELNKLAKTLSKEYGLKLIGANDSHYIYPQESKLRDNLLEVKRIVYSEDADESQFYMDYPDKKTMFNRFMEQNIWTENEVMSLIDNTNILSDVEDIILDTNWKIPSAFPDMTEKEKLQQYINIINKHIDDNFSNLSEEEKKIKVDGIKEEITEVVKAHIVDYQPIISKIVQRAKEKGGAITTSGRGSASSYYTNKIFGFTSVDRFTSKVPLLMERFMTADKVLKNHEMMDIDNNIYGIEKFVEAQEEILGKNNSAPIVAYGTLKTKSAFKLLCNTKDDISPTLQNEMSAKIDEYQKDYDYADEDEKDDIRIEDYLDNDDLVKLYQESKKYLGIVTDLKKHASAYCIADHDIVSKFGILKTRKNDIVLNLEGSQLDILGYVKIDWLQVDVVGIIEAVYKEIGMPVPSTDELYEMVKGDKATWDIYENGLTMCVNQVEKPKTREKVMRYKPKTVEELASFISAVRPAFMTYYKRFENREHFEFGLEALDKLLQGEFLDSSWILYQESIMLLVMWLGFEKRESAKLMKFISKKKKDKIAMISQRFHEKCEAEFIKSGFTPEEAKKKTESIWEVIENAGAYGFNASHALNMAFDSLYVAWAKAHYPKQTYYAMIKFYIDKQDKKIDKISKIKSEAQKYGIQILNYKFRQDNRTINMDENGNIVQCLFTIKKTNIHTAEILYELKDWKGNFVDLYNEMKNRGIKQDVIKALIYIEYFSEFGTIGELLWVINNYKEVSQLRYENFKKTYYSLLRELVVSYDDLVSEFESIAKKHTDKTITFNNKQDYFNILYNNKRVEDISMLEKIFRQIEILEYTFIVPTNKVGKVKVYKPEKNSLLLEYVGESKEQWFKLNNFGQSMKKNDIVYLSNVVTKKYQFKKNGEIIERESYIINQCYNLTSLFKK